MDPLPDVVGAIADTRADQAWSAICDLIASQRLPADKLRQLVDAVDANDPSAIRALDDECLGMIAPLSYAAIHYAGARMMERMGEDD